MTRAPASTLREQLLKLSKRGVVDSRPHRLHLLGFRPPRRFIPTYAGIRVIADDDDDVQRLLWTYPVSKRWFRLLADRLDAFALVYRVAPLIAEANPERQPARVEHPRQVPTSQSSRSPGVAVSDSSARDRC